MKTARHILLTALAAILAVACADDGDAPQDAAVVRMPVTISVPAEALGTRANPGDPGAAEEFQAPDHAYIYVVTTLADNTVKVSKLETKLDTKLWQPRDKNPYDPTDPDATRPTEIIYDYTGPLFITLPSENRTAGRVYAAVSHGELSLTGNTNPTTEDEVKAITYSCSATSDLRDLYSSPYNLNKDNTSTYYGTIESIASSVPRASLVLYHTCARIDVMWNVPSTNKKLSSITLNGMLASPCCLFKPLENAAPTTTGNSFSCSILDAFSPATQWYGRAVVYAPVYKSANANTMPLAFTLTPTAGDAKEKTVNVTVDDGVFTPWMRGTITW